MDYPWWLFCHKPTACHGSTPPSLPLHSLPPYAIPGALFVTILLLVTALHRLVSRYTRYPHRLSLVALFVAALLLVETLLASLSLLTLPLQTIFDEFLLVTALLPSLCLYPRYRHRLSLVVLFVPALLLVTPPPPCFPLHSQLQRTLPVVLFVTDALLFAALPHSVRLHSLSPWF